MTGRDDARGNQPPQRRSAYGGRSTGHGGSAGSGRQPAAAGRSTTGTAAAKPPGGKPPRGKQTGGKPAGRPPGKRGRRRGLRWWQWLLGSVLALGALGFGVLVVAYVLTDIPEPEDFVSAQTTTVYYADGETVMGTFGVQNRELVELSTLPDHVAHAIVAAEDRTFYNNAGISVRGLVRAAWNNLRGGATQGGSTITQQYAERYYLGTTRDYLGKFKEAILAIKLDQQEDKETILQNYLNTIYFGRGAYGIQTAAQAYFGVDAADLTVSQSALLAGIVPAPSRWDPRLDPERAEQRWNYVLDGMVAEGWLTAEERAAQVFPETIEYTQNNTYGGSQGYLLDMVRREITGRAEITEDELDTLGFRIVTTIDARVQQAAVDAVATLPEDAPANLRTALVALDPADGAIVALYGGADYLEVQRNAVTQDTAQAGSTFKPFALVAALEQGVSLETRFNGNNGLTIDGFDEPVNNFGSVNYGVIDLVRATARSVNTVYVQLNAQVGPELTRQVAVRAGLPEDTVGLEGNLANVLGTASPHPLDMASAYATFAAQGVRTTPFIVRTAHSLDGTLAYEGAQDGERVFAADVMADTTYALTQVVADRNGSGAVARALGRPVAGKTGTSNANRSAWFVGYVPQLTSAVAMYQVGANGETEEITPFGGVDAVTGGTFPVQVWTAFMTAALEGTEVLDFPERADVGQVEDPEGLPTTVPELVGLTEADAMAALEQAHLVAVVRVEADDVVPEGTVISADPPPGTRLTERSTVTLVVSGGPAEAEPSEDGEPSEGEQPPDGEESPPPEPGDGEPGAGEAEQAP